ncbi:MAG: hypothetical protein KGI27_14070 [Thaumarchaeota archaeon]|nr:hypothetical protein [Nitrososphaerota archaeon]
MDRGIILALLVIAVNKSNLAPESEYNVEVSINRKKFLYTGTVSHIRADGASVLLRKIADEMDTEAGSIHESSK